MNTETTKAHAKYSASGSERWLNCAASIALSEKAPLQFDSEYAKEGTHAHACLEAFLKSKNKVAVRKFLLMKFPEEMVGHVEDAYNAITNRVKPGDILLCETRVDASSFTTKDQFGTVDAAIVEEFGRLTVIDFKYGAGIAVDPEDNSQLIYYALGLAHKYDYNFQDVMIVVIQPRAQDGRGSIKEWLISIDELKSWADKFRKGVQACEDPLAKFKSGDWCRFCPAKTICPEISTKAYEQAQIDFTPTGEIKLPSTLKISSSDLGIKLEAAQKLKVWISAIEEYALHALERGEKVQGYKLVQKRSTRKWINPEKAAKEAMKYFGEAAFTKPELLSPAQFLKAISRVTNDDSAEPFMKSRITDESSGRTLVSESDPRPAINLIEADFGKGEIVAKKVAKKKSKKVVKKKKSK
jgi:Protein of unknown function (DUF2800)